MKALLVIDVQNGFLKLGNFEKEIENIKTLIKKFKENKEPVILFKHIDENENSPIFYNSENSKIESEILKNGDFVLEKKFPNSFKDTKLEKILKENNVDEVYIAGFNTEYCILFTSICATDRNYKVTLIEDASGTVNKGEVYEYENLDIRDFISTILDWSEMLQVLNTEELLN